MKRIGGVLCVLLVGILIGSTFSHQIVGKAEAEEPTLWEIVAWLIQYFVVEHDGNPDAHPGRGGVHVIDADGNEVGVLYEDKDEVFNPGLGLTFRIDYWSGEVRPDETEESKLFESTDCTGDWYVRGRHPHETFGITGESGVHTVTAVERKPIRSSWHNFIGVPECSINCLASAEECMEPVAVAWDEVTLPSAFPAPFSLEVR